MEQYVLWLCIYLLFSFKINFFSIPYDVKDKNIELISIFNLSKKPGCISAD